MVVTSQKYEVKRLRLEIRGVVQGVGFRPFVYSAAKKFGLNGFVGNDGLGVFIEIEGKDQFLNQFVEFVRINAPPLSFISDVRLQTIELKHDSQFHIIESEAHDTNFTLISPDISICDDCKRELFDIQDRRFLYPFINCTNCGPRFTIIQNIPYDRSNTTMSTFTMCDACRAEYGDPLTRRFHAQPISCWDCGPKLSFYCSEKRGNAAAETDEIKQTIEDLIGGQIVAIKGIGGFHLACDARNTKAIEALRLRKGRFDKPFAVMFKDTETARKFVEISEAEAHILTSRERPIVLLKKKNERDFNIENAPVDGKDFVLEQVAPNNQFLGVMLPYSPLHYLLFRRELDVLVMTSGNLSNEPIIKDNGEAVTKLKDLADSFLLHDREIFVQCDDSVVRILGTENQERNNKKTSVNAVSAELSSFLPYRRSRGYAPLPVELPFKVPNILAVGGELKSTFCLTKDNFAFMSQHIGDMENLETLESFEKSYHQMKQIFCVEPEIVVGDLHPNYLSSNWARKTCTNFVAVQHHHAHIASVMAENGIKGENLVGFAFDGTGFGTDGAVWGGEVLLANYEKFQRLTHLRYFPLAGGDVSVKNVYRLALSVLREAGIEWTEDLACVSIASKTERNVLLKQFENNLNVVQTSSFGRLFDAIASIANIRQYATYEAQAAIEFEGLIDENITDAYEFEIFEHEIDYRNLAREVVKDVLRNTSNSIIAAKFHNAIAKLILRLSLNYRKEFKVNKIALSGGCFQNVGLLKRAVKLLRINEFEVLTHKHVPPNDGGLALGQAVIAASIAEACTK